MKNTVFLSLVVVGIFLLSGFGVLAQAPGIQINLSKHRAVENYVVESSHPYTNNYDNTWTITKSGASKIKIHFTSYTEVENTYDFLYFYDGSGTQIWKKTGTLGAFWTEWVNGDTVKVRLTTDYSVTKYGFKIDQREYETVTSSDVELSSGVAYSDSLSATGNMDYYKINVPSGSTKLEVILDGPASGCDFDLYVKYNQRPTTSSYDGRGYTSSSDETVTINSPSTGYYYIMPYSYSGSGSYSIKATVTGGSSDTTPPTISNIQSSSITSSGATITWTTNEASSSVVEYGTTTSYGSTATGTNSVTSHSVGLSGLSAGTTYHYRVKSADSSGNLATSGDYTFATTATSTQNDAGSGTDAGNTFDTALQINPGSYSGYMDSADGNDYYKFNVNSGQTIQVSMTPPSGADFDLKLYNPSNTQKASSTAGAGSTDSVTFTADSAGYWRARIYYYSGSGTYSFTVSVTGGGGGGTLGDAVDNTALTWTTGGNANWAVDTTTYYHGTASAKSGTITHNQNTYIQTTVTGAGTLTFYWKVSSESNYDYLRFHIDSAEQTKISGTVDWQQKSYSIASGSHTLKWAYTKDGSVSSGSDRGWLDKIVFTASGGDTTPPVINNVQSSSITSSGATITWTTDEASSSVVEYGTTTSYGSTATGSNGVTSHSVALSGLTAGTTYHYRVKSADSSNNLATSGDYTFTTTAASSDIELTSGVAYSESLSATGDVDYYKINVPSGSTKLDVVLDGPNSGCDFDLYVKYNQRPTTSSYDGRGYTSSSDETVTINSPSTGYYYIMPYSYSGSGSYTIKATVTGGGSSGGKYAVIVGINDYQYISDLSYCVNDANDWKPYLETQGYTISSFLTNSQATETNITNGIANAISQAGSTGTVAFIFAGHGGKYSETGLSGEGSVCYCYNGSTSSGTNGNLQDTELQSCFSGYTGKVFIFLDSCRSGGMNEVVSNDPNGANRYMATTCGPNGYGYDEPSYLNGAWTYWFLEKGLVNGGSGCTDMEGNFNWAKNNYPYTGDDAPMQFDGNTSSLFYL